MNRPHLPAIAEVNCGYERVGALVVVTNAAMGFPAAIEGKPIFVHELGKGWL